MNLGRAGKVARCHRDSGGCNCSGSAEHLGPQAFPFSEFQKFKQVTSKGFGVFMM